MWKKDKTPLKSRRKSYCRECYNIQQREEKILSKQVRGKFDGMLLAKDVIKNPTLIDNYKGKYAVLVDWGVTGVSGPIMNNLNIVINMFADKGWQCINITSTGQGFLGCYALMEKIEDSP